jgi:sulfatase modifying factor 1
VPFRTEDWARPYNWDQQRRVPPPGKENHPVVLVSWDDVRAYCAWAGLRLPAEAEWEKAAGWDFQAGRKRRYPWGDTWDGRKCNTAERLAGRELPTHDEWKKWRDGWLKLDPVKRNQDTTTPVGAYSPAGDSPCGCADMAGNVWEWTASDYDKSHKVLRGGGWLNIRYGARVASRYRLRPDYRDITIGFRCAGSFS